MTDIPLSKRLAVAKIETLNEIMREAEAYLNSQWSAAVAADQRAYTFSGFCSAAAVVLVGGSYSLVTAARPDILMATVSALVAATLLWAAWQAVRSAGPIGFEYVGNQPSNWADDVEAGMTLTAALAEQCQHYDEMITENTTVLRENARKFQTGSQTALIGLIFGAATFSVWLASKWI